MPREDFPFECVDEWPGGSLTITKLAAYRSLMLEKTIRIEKAIYRKHDRHTTVRYVSKIHHKLALERLKAHADELAVFKELFERACDDEDLQ